MRIKGPTIRNKGDPLWEAVQISPSDIKWHRVVWKKLVYRYFLNWFNRVLWKHFTKEIEL
jgi:hypothetical protein